MKTGAKDLTVTLLRNDRDKDNAVDGWIDNLMTQSTYTHIYVWIENKLGFRELMMTMTDDDGDEDDNAEKKLDERPSPWEDVSLSWLAHIHKPSN